MPRWHWSRVQERVRGGVGKRFLFWVKAGNEKTEGTTVTTEYTFQKLRFRRRAKVGERTKGKKSKNGSLES